MLDMYGMLVQLYPICRSITGNGARQTLQMIQRQLPDLVIHEVPSGTKAFDWTVPDEWNIFEAKLTDPDGNIVADFSKNNLHVVGYSEPVNRIVCLEELQEHLYSRKDLPDAIPYVTAYYKRNWGFCISDNVRKNLKSGDYHVFIDSTLEPGSLSYGELHIPGKSTKEVLLSTYICHPSLANNELSGPVLATALAQWISAEERKYSYRILFIPETIGSLVYLSRHLGELREKVIAGFNLTCLGDEGEFSYLPSRNGSTLSDAVAIHVLNNFTNGFKRYTFLDRGSDERQYCAPGIDLPICLIMRSKFGAYPEYHTSLDNTQFVTEKALSESYDILMKCLMAIEAETTYATNILGEPQLRKYGLYPDISAVGNYDSFIITLLDLLAYTDGKMSILEIADTIGCDIFTLSTIAEKVTQKGILHRVALK